MMGASKRQKSRAWVLGALLALGACGKSSSDESHPVECGALCRSEVRITVTLPVPLAELANKKVTACRNVDTCFSAQLGDNAELGQIIDFGIPRNQVPVEVDLTGTPHNLKVLLIWGVTVADAKDGDRYSVRFGDDLVVVDQPVTYDDTAGCGGPCKEAFVDMTPPTVPEPPNTGGASAGDAGVGGDGARSGNAPGEGGEGGESRLRDACGPYPLSDICNDRPASCPASPADISPDQCLFSEVKRYASSCGGTVVQSVSDPIAVTTWSFDADDHLTGLVVTGDLGNDCKEGGTSFTVVYGEPCEASGAGELLCSGAGGAGGAGGAP